MRRYVLDASVVVKLFFEEEHSEAAVGLVDRAEGLLAPDFLMLEFANVVWKRAKRDNLTHEKAITALQQMVELPIVTHATSPLITSSFALATLTGRTVYDCTYLALAISEGCPLVTADERFFNALKNSAWGVHLQFISDTAH